MRTCFRKIIIFCLFFDMHISNKFCKIYRTEPATFPKKSVSGFSYNFCKIFQNRYLSYCDWLFHDGGRCHIETSRLICRANQWTGFYMKTASVMKELKKLGSILFYRLRTLIIFNTVSLKKAKFITTLCYMSNRFVSN